MRNIASEGKGNLITFDGSIQGMERSLRQLMAMQRYDDSGTSEDVAADEVVEPSASPYEAPASDMRSWNPPTNPPTTR